MCPFLSSYFSCVQCLVSSEKVFAFYILLLWHFELLLKHCSWTIFHVFVQHQHDSLKVITTSQWNKRLSAFPFCTLGVKFTQSVIYHSWKFVIVSHYSDTVFSYFTKKNSEKCVKYLKTVVTCTFCFCFILVPVSLFVLIYLPLVCFYVLLCVSYNNCLQLRSSCLSVHIKGLLTKFHL